MNTPIYDFVSGYAARGLSRLHMPGHKGRGMLGCEALDITEIAGADALYEADGIIAQSEANAAALFGSRRTLFSTEGSSQCIRAMLALTVTHRAKGSLPLVLAARNVHKAFIYAAALVGFDVQWLLPQTSTSSICACPVSPKALDAALSRLPAPPAAVYVTSPDYLGGMQDLRALSDVCHAHGTILAVDNAHGAYLHFCAPALHPLDLGADICCDSAHKTLPVLTGGAYLHIAKRAPKAFADHAKTALSLFGSTSPSYLTLCSLDLANAELADAYPARLRETVRRLDALCSALTDAGWKLTHDEPLKITLHASACGLTGVQLAERIRSGGVEGEYADADDLVLMASPHNTQADFERLRAALGKPDGAPLARMPLPLVAGRQAMSIREAFFSAHEALPVKKALGRICAAPTVSCPPAIPIAISGEIITREALTLFEKYGIDAVDVVCERGEP